MLEIDIQELVWDSFNESHIWEKHQITRAEVEEICLSDSPSFLVEVTHDGRYRVIGPRNDGKVLVVILAPEDEERGIYYPVTEKQTKRQELRRYIAWKAGTSDE
jgi:uncharacterized DUF497 family protein